MRNKGCAISVGMAIMLAMVFSGRAYGDLILSDTITVNIKSINSGNPQNPNTVTMTIPEVANSGEDPIAIDLSTASGFIGKDGYILFCEPPMKPVVGCGPNNGFKGVSDILVKGEQTANHNKPAYFFFSDSDTGPLDAVGTLMALYKVKTIGKIPAPLGPIGGVLETGNAQPVGNLFAFPNNNAIIVTSDLDAPEPNSIILLLVMVAAMAARRPVVRKKPAQVSSVETTRPYVN